MKTPEHPFKVLAVEDEEPVEAFAARAADERLGDGVGLGARHDDLEFLGLRRTKTQNGELQDTPNQ
jgi:hypothetical protein